MLYADGRFHIPLRGSPGFAPAVPALRCSIRDTVRPRAGARSRTVGNRWDQRVIFFVLAEVRDLVVQPALVTVTLTLILLPRSFAVRR